MTVFRSIALVAAVAFMALVMGPQPSLAGATDAPPTVTIAYQPGISYASLIVMKAQGTLEKAYPNTKFDWKVLANGAAIRDGIIAGQIQIGAGGIGPFLIGWDRGVGYKLIASLNLMDLWLVAKDPKIKTLKDFTPDMKIGMPSPDAIQGIVLRKGAQDQLGNAHALDGNILAIEHPLGVQALLNGQIAGHLSSPPFQYQEVAAGGHVILRSWDVFGRSTFNSVFSTDKFYNDYPGFVNTFYKKLIDATYYVKSNPKATAQILAKDSGNAVPAADFQKWISRPDTIFVTTPHGFMKYATFMKSIGMISKVPASMHDIELPTLGNAGD